MVLESALSRSEGAMYAFIVESNDRCHRQRRPREIEAGQPLSERPGKSTLQCNGHLPFDSPHTEIRQARMPSVTWIAAISFAWSRKAPLQQNRLVAAAVGAMLVSCWCGHGYGVCQTSRCLHTHPRILSASRSLNTLFLRPNRAPCPMTCVSLQHAGRQHPF